MAQQVKNRSAIIGALLIVFGSLFLLNNTNIIPDYIADYVLNWRGILIAVGVVLVTTDENKLPGVMLILIGGFFVLSNVMHEHFQIDFISWRVFWPILIIVGGVMLILRRGNVGMFQKGDDVDYEHVVDGDSSDMLDITAVLGGGDVTVQSSNFRGGKVTCFMGGGNYDLSTCQLARGPQVIDVFAMFGGASFIVPSDWKVRVEVTSLFGGFTDSRKRTNLTAAEDSDRELIIRGTVLFGGGEIKNYV